MTTNHPKYDVLGPQPALTIERYRELDAAGVNLDSWRDFHRYIDPLDPRFGGVTGKGALIRNVAGLTRSRIR